jgi:hypothetical protein
MTWRMTAIPSGKMMRPIAGAFAEYERSRLVSKSTSAPLAGQPWKHR